MTEPAGETAPEAPEDVAPEDAPTSTETADTVEAPSEEAPEEASEGTSPEKASEGASTQEAATEETAPEVSEAQAELAAQRELRARIEARKAEKSGPVVSGAKLSGTAADLLAAVRAVEGGSASGGAFYAPAPEPTRPTRPPETTVRPPAPAAPAAPTAGALAGVREVLARGGAPEALAGQVVGALGEQAAEALTEDPWQLLAVPGVRPEQADGFARALLGGACGPDDPRRAVALTVWLLDRAALQGHTALTVDEVAAGLARHQVPDPEKAVGTAVSEGAVLVFQEEDEAPREPEEDAEGEEGEEGEAGAEGAGPDGGPAEPALLGLDRYALAEESLADGLARLVRTVTAREWDGGELERAVGGHGLVLHTGGEAARAEPLELAATARERGLRVLVTVHDAERLSEEDRASGRAVTLAALLSGTAGPGRDEEGSLALDLLVVLDAPQLDVETGAMLVEALPDGCRLVLSGDPEVLGATGPGAVFADALAARVCPRVASRRPDPGPLGELVSGIGIGELNQVEAPGKEVVIVPVRDAGEAVHRTVQLVADSVPRAFGLTPEQTRVITVGHGGSAGTRALNTALKQRLNPGPGRFGGYDPGDRVAYAPVPGRTVTGTVLGADAEGLRVRTGDGEVLVPKERVESALRHGWALTAHQAAGGRWPAVVVVLPGDAAPGLSRPWVYTAFGRAERHLSVVHGVDQALPRSVAEVLAPARTTRLRPLLIALLAASGEE
ncbi:ATP-binding domain-containing protein [Streptomyces sp. R302]|uniref:helix-hairpin-helix domain-containing protein n=1 Tax=unclassified Streptomyces TaxID=2593676 RepID=UPI00145D1B71|nr:ATP-binding domain-containing protein [Streptomyces sp. R301]NML81793.1 ATP-binding domain-containing protein [Streptomyces sp. R302]